MDSGPGHLPTRDLSHRVIARAMLVAFLFTFMMARVTVFLIVSQRLPDIYLYVGGTHIHHLNYGIFLLSGVGAYLLLVRPSGPALWRTALVYGVGLALTFDEFGMWLHLGGSYWQRASFDAIVVIAALLGLIAVGPSLRRFRPRHWVTAGALTVTLVVFGAMLVDSLKYADQLLLRMQIIEQSSPVR